MPLTLQLQGLAAVPLQTGDNFTVGPWSIIGQIAPILLSSSLTSSGSTTIAVPSNSIGVIVTPPSTNGVTLTMKLGTTGDTGYKIPMATRSIVNWDPNNIPANLYVVTGGTFSGYCTFLFF